MQGVLDAFLAVAAVGGDGAWRAPGSLGDPPDRRRQLRRVGRVAHLDGVIDDDAVLVVGDLSFVAELDRLAQAALGDRAGIAIMQADPPSGAVGDLSGHPLAGLRGDLAGRGHQLGKVVDRAHQPATPPPRRRVMFAAGAQRGSLRRGTRTARLALTSSRWASRAAVSANPTSSPVLLSTAAVAWSRPNAARERSFDAIASARLPAAQDRSRTRVRTAPPAAWIR